MDLILEYADKYALDALYPADIPRDSLSRQVAPLLVLPSRAVTSSTSWAPGSRTSNKELMKHPKFLKNQVRREISASCKSMALLTLPWFLADVRGYSKTYSEFGKFGYSFEALSVFYFVMFSDMLIYWFHRWLHHPLIYSTLHKPHHKWVICSTFSSHAFHPLDSYIQSLPYHFYVMLFPIHRGLFLALFVAVNFWTISIHDGLFLSRNKIVNGALFHAVHHERYRFNYGQYLTFSDRIGGTYLDPPSTGYSVPKAKKLE